MLSISTAGVCPRFARGTVDSKASGATTTLTPSHPTGGLVCRYSGNGQRLLASAHLSAKAAERIAMLLDGLPGGQGNVSCPNDSGGRDVLAFAYHGQSDGNVEVSLSGCGDVTNGHIGRQSTRTLISALTAVTGKAS